MATPSDRRLHTPTDYPCPYPFDNGTKLPGSVIYVSKLFFRTLLSICFTGSGGFHLGFGSACPTFDADGDALAQRLPDQVPRGQRQLLTRQPLGVSWKREDGDKTVSEPNTLTFILKRTKFTPNQQR